MTVSVGVLGATGAVGQRLIQLLDPHPDFELTTLTASDTSAGHPYREVAKWRVDTPIPEAVAGMTVRRTDPADIPDDVDLLFPRSRRASASASNPRSVRPATSSRRTPRTTALPLTYH